MADGKDEQVSIDEGHISDESDFYGDAETKASFEERAAEFDDTEYWKSHQASLTEKADYSVAQALAKSTTKSSSRLPPRTTQFSESIPWIYITNPFRKVPKGIAVNEEAPPGEDSDWGKCVTEGNRLLEELITIRNTIEKQILKKSTIAINRLINKEKELIVKKF
ncbi:hypothetical protein DID88_002527 [Monilinia fructigena]|uniref:Uncharacterized protein n=1 Tax=Monilinia fructigena TaxID=38457 RepID=A0A395IP25_9HELO|nr:hypothetical protein DID88_002527 [Monilinia fructigena]